jgi:hypothetical protein
MSGGALFGVRVSSRAVAASRPRRPVPRWLREAGETWPRPSSRRRRVLTS